MRADIIFPANLNFNWAAISRGIIAAYFGIYAALVFLYPSSYAEFLGLGTLFYLVISTVLICSILLAADYGSIVASLGLFAFMTFVEQFYFCNSEQLDWAYLGWTLAGMALIKFGINRSRIIELGWFVAGFTYTVQGIAKILLVGGDWLGGVVIYSLMSWIVPSLTQTLFHMGLLKIVVLLMSWSAIIFHLSALPLAMIPRMRKWLWLFAMIFHVLLLATPFYYVSFGMIAFWTFLAQYFEAPKTLEPS